MEKRRVAPGYLDTGMRILEPTRSGMGGGSPPSGGGGASAGGGRARDNGGGDELDRVFGKMRV